MSGIVDKWLILEGAGPEGAGFLFQASGAYFGLSNCTREGWLGEGRNLNL
jgi:hypothetical protein